MRATITQANTGKLVSTSKFAGYDHCLNPYVGCEFGCKYCYVRFFIKGDAPWGEWVRIRWHIHKKLAAELTKVGPTRLVIGTMCDPYQPAEIKHRLTRASLKLIAASETRMKKVGIFTRSPLIVQDAELIASLPRARVHFTVSPFDEKTRKIVEPYPISAKARFRAIEKLQKAGIRVHVNVAPALPIVSDRLIEPYAKILAAMKVNEFFVDPMQPYSDSFDAMRAAMGGSEEWAAIEDIVLNKRNYRIWKQEFHRKWTEAWKAVQNKSPDTMPISSDHATKKKINMNTGEYLDWELYDQYEGR